MMMSQMMKLDISSAITNVKEGFEFLDWSVIESSNEDYFIKTPSKIIQ